jgi:hypothetical protein
MIHSLTLEDVQKDFQHWRQIRKKRASIPDDLWQRVFPLLNRYPISKICSALSLNTAQIRTKMGSNKPITKSKPKQLFVELPLKSAHIIEDKTGIKIEIIRKDGASMSISAFPSNALKVLIEQFLMG